MRLAGANAVVAAAYHLTAWQQASTILGIVGVSVAIIAAAAFAILYFRGSYTKATIDTLKSNNDALLERVELLDDRATECAARCDALERENDVLKRLVTGADAIKELQTAVASVHKLLTDAHHEVMAMAAEILKDIEHLHGDHTHARAPGHGH